VLLVAPPRVRDRDAVTGHTIVGGMPLEQRIAKAGERGGFTRVVRAASGAVDAAAAAFPATTGPARVVVAPANVIPQAAWLRRFPGCSVDRDTLYADDSGVALIETDDPRALLAAVASHPRDADVLDAVRKRAVREVAVAFEPWGRFVISSRDDLRAAESWLLRSLIKPSEGFMSRHFERRLSLAVTRRLAPTSVTPNMMTVVSLVIGLGSAPFFLASTPVRQVTGALLFLLHSILDGCDGELARLKFMESPGGARLDFWGDNAVHVAVFSAMAIGAAISHGSWWPLAVGAIAVASVLATAATLSDRFLGGPSAAVGPEAVINAMAHRDFIYLIVLLSFFGKAAWFLAIAAVGTPLFLAIALIVRRRAAR
jgi:phosphatidylglycerophosphate synthase